MKLLLLIVGLCCAISSKASTNVTIYTTATVGANFNFFTVPTNKVARLISFHSDAPNGYQMRLDNGVQPWMFLNSNELRTASLVFVGPLTIGTQQPTNQTSCYTLELSSNEEIYQTPSGSVVIPSDSAGPVDIILESSIDLVSWTPALPGTYGAYTARRFFRVRAVASP